MIRLIATEINLLAGEARNDHGIVYTSKEVRTPALVTCVSEPDVPALEMCCRWDG